MGNTRGHPTRYQMDMLEELHVGHPGIVRMATFGGQNIDSETDCEELL